MGAPTLDRVQRGHFPTSRRHHGALATGHGRAADVATAQSMWPHVWRRLSAALWQQDAAHDCRQTRAAFVMETTAFVCGRWKKRAPHFPYSIILCHSLHLPSIFSLTRVEYTEVRIWNMGIWRFG